MDKKTIEVPVGNKKYIFETGRIARQAGGSVLVHCEDTTVMATACASKTASSEIDFLPLRVDYQEKFSSVGKTLGGFIKREGRPTERETLVCRLIDRPLRPLFEDGYFNEVQLLAYVYSYDGANSPDVLSICAASAALTISEIPLAKPIGAVRVGRIDGEFVLNPSFEEMDKSDLDLILAGTEDAILMIEGYCDFLTEEEVLESIECGHKAIKGICQALMKWRDEVGKPKNRDTISKIPEHTKKAVEEIALEPLKKAINIAAKQEREAAMSEIREKVAEALIESENTEHLKRDVQMYFKKLSSKVMRDMVLSTKKRIDGRDLDQVRPIHIEQGILPRTHGSSLFTRGETQALAVCTLGGETMGQRYEDLHGDSTRRFYLQYSFPPFSVGEVGRSGPPGRREVGHGKLAERALTAVLPKQEDFPYVIRLESNITESNGSSSMASVCGGCLALMDAGVSIKKPVSGIAMGLILENDQHVILSDILGTEDFLGDMDFKITGDDQGITAFQMDIKVEGINIEIMKKALAQAKDGRVHILKKMLEACPEPKTEMSAYAPRIETIQVKQSQIGMIIGPGGKQIRAIVDETGVEIDINDDGVVSISSNNGEAMEKAKEIIHNLTADVEIGQIYKGKITSIVDFGIFVQIFSKEGLCHISQISHERISGGDELKKMFKVGEEIEVKVIDINDRGQIKLSRKVLLEKPEAASK